MFHRLKNVAVKFLKKTTTLVITQKNIHHYGFWSQILKFTFFIKNLHVKPEGKHILLL
jgi:hypothetical protein